MYFCYHDNEYFKFQKLLKNFKNGLNAPLMAIFLHVQGCERTKKLKETPLSRLVELRHKKTSILLRKKNNLDPN
jgi:hypothetical protein